MKCHECPNHKVIPDPDPDDSFNRDDVAIVCKLAANPDPDMSSRYLADRQELRPVSKSLRPYEVDKIDAPKWCPKDHGPAEKTEPAKESSQWLG